VLPDVGDSGDRKSSGMIVIAVAPAEAPVLTEALTTGARLFVAARSKQADGAEEPAGGADEEDPPEPEPPAPADDEITDEHNPLRDVQTIQGIVGGSRRTLVFVGNEQVTPVAQTPAEDSAATEPAPPDAE
jgi:hypothetical protein